VKHWLLALGAAILGGTFLYYITGEEQEEKTEEKTETYSDLGLVSGDDYERHIKPRVLLMHKQHKELLAKQPNFHGYPQHLHYTVGRATVVVDCYTDTIIDLGLDKHFKAV
jgi:hypothetical protein